MRLEGVQYGFKFLMTKDHPRRLEIRDRYGIYFLRKMQVSTCRSDERRPVFVVRTEEGVIYAKNEQDPLTEADAEKKCSIANKRAEELGIKTRYVVDQED